MAQTNVLSISLKDYKKQIDSLRGSLLTLQKGSAEYDKVLADIRGKQEKLNQVMADTKGTVAAAENSMNALKAQLKDMKKEAGNLDVGSDRFKELSVQILETTNKLKDLEATQGTFSRNVGNYESALAPLKSQLKEVTQEMATMLSQGVAPTDAAFLALAQKAGDMKDAIADANSVISHFADDTKGLSTAIDLAKTGTAIYGTYKGALSIFGIENENVTKSMEIMGGVMTTLTSLQQLQTALVDRASITYRAYQGVVELSNKALAALGLTTKATAAATATDTTATVANTTAMVANTTATTAATVATNLFKKALIATGIGAVVVAVGELVAHLGDLVEGFKNACRWVGESTGLIHKQTAAEKAAVEQQKKYREELDALSKKQKELNETNIELTSSYTQLKAIWDSLDTLQDRQKFVEQYKNEMSALGAEINNVNDAEKFFSNQGASDFAKSIEIRAKLVIKQTQLMNTLKKIEDATANGAWAGPHLNALLQEKADILAEIVSLSRELSDFSTKYTSTSISTSKTSKTPKTSTTKESIDIAADLEEITKKWTESIDEVIFRQKLLEAQGRSTLQSQSEMYRGIYELNRDYYRSINDQLMNYYDKKKLTEKEIDEIDRKVYENNINIRKNIRQYQIDDAEFRVRLAKETARKIINEAQDAAKQGQFLVEKAAGPEYMEQAFPNFNIIEDYIKLFSDINPEIAKAIIKSDKSLSKATQDYIGELLDESYTENLDKQKEYQRKIEEDRLKYQETYISSIKFAKDLAAKEIGKANLEIVDQERALLEKENEINEQYEAKIKEIESKRPEVEENLAAIAREYGEDSLEYIARKDAFDKQVEEIEIAHNEALLEIMNERKAIEDQALQIGLADPSILTIEEEIYREEEKLTSEHYKKLAKIEADYQKETKNRNKQKLNSWLNFSSGVASIIDNVADIMEEDIVRQKEEGKITEEEAKKRFETVKAMQIAAATVDMLAGAVGGFMGAMQDKSIFPSWLRPVLGGVYAAAALTAGAANIASIKSTQFGSSGSSSGTSSVPATRDAVNIDFSGVNVNPLIDETADINRMTTLSETQSGDTRVYILQSDLEDSSRQVQIRQNNTTF